MTCSQAVNIPFNYQYQLHAAIYKLLKQSSPQYSEFLHDTGFIDRNKHLKLFVFSKLLLVNSMPCKTGFQNVEQAILYFSTPIPKSFEHLVLGIFSDQKILLNLCAKPCIFCIEDVETLPEPYFKSEMKFTCLSPVAIAGFSGETNGKHYYDYMVPSEKLAYINGLKTNLLRKYRLINGSEFSGDETFDFSFDPLYIIKKKGKIRKNIKFKSSHIIAMEAPFTISAAPELIRVGYECGFGINNSDGFGMSGVISG